MRRGTKRRVGGEDWRKVQVACYRTNGFVYLIMAFGTQKWHGKVLLGIITVERNTGIRTGTVRSGLFLDGRSASWVVCPSWGDGMERMHLSGAGS